MFCPLALSGAFFETGEVTLTDTIDNGGWVTVTTQKNYTSPVVIAGPITHNNDNSLSVRVRNASGNSFQVGMQSPCQSSGGGAVTCPSSWANETVSWMVVERGTWIFPDGTKIEAYIHNTDTIRARFGGNSSAGDVISYSHSYSSAPVVLHTVNSANDSEWVATTAFAPTGNKRNPPNSSGFRLALEGSEVTTSHGAEDIGWVAIERASGTNNGNSYVAARTANRAVDRHNDECQALSYGTSFSGIPNLLAQHNSMDGGDGAWLRLCGAELQATQFNVHMEEDQVNDSDRTGLPEYAAWFAFQAGSVGALEFLTATKTYTDGNDNLLGPGELVTFNIVITNLQDDFAQADNSANEFVDTLNSNFVIESGTLTASSGTISTSGQDILWDGTVPASGVVNLSYQARIADNATVCTLASTPNQAQLNMDPIDDSIQAGDIDNANSAIELSDDPAEDDGNDTDLDGLTNDDDPTLVDISCRSDVLIEKNDGANTNYTPGESTTYTIVVTNNGPHNLIGAIINDALPANVSNNGNWTCDPSIAPGDNSASCISGNAAGTTASGTGDVNLTVDIPSGKSLVISLPVTYATTP